MDPILNDLVIDLLVAVALVLVAVLGWNSRQLIAVAKQKLEASLGKEKLDILVSTVEVVVRGLEQSPISRLGEEKFEIAKLKALEYVRELGLNMSNEDLDLIIERAVQVMNAELKGAKSEDDLSG